MQIIILPGASLMEITPLNDGVRVRCPGCGNVEEFHGKGERAFAHEDRCPVHARIEKAIRRYERDEVKRG